MKGKLKQTKGITLIALIITIIVLLILAVVSIRLVVNNGILGKAESGVNTYSESETEEKIKLAYSDYQMGKLTDSGYTFEQALQNGKVAYTSVTGSDAEGYIVTATLSDGTEKKFNVTSAGVNKIKTTVEEYGLKIGDYVAYDATKDANGNTITGEKATYTSYSASTANSDKNDGRSSGYKSNQVFNLSSYTGGWRVLGVKNGQLELISADIIGPDSGGNTSGSNKYYYLTGKKGYTDGPGELNAISAMYGQGKGATGARSINVEDVNKITGYNPEKTGDGKPYGSGTMSEYNNKVTYYWDGTNYPYYEYGEGENQKTGNLGASHGSSFNWYNGTNWQRSTKDANASTSNRIKITDLTSNDYTYKPTTLTTSLSGDVKGIAKTSKEWEVLFANTAYPNFKYFWLASPNVSCWSYCSAFALWRVIYEAVESDEYLYDTDGDSYDNDNGVRPVVSLKSDILIEKTDAKDGSTLEKACIIK